jgi:hypothetical protein
MPPADDSSFCFIPSFSLFSFDFFVVERMRVRKEMRRSGLLSKRRISSLITHKKVNYSE